MLTIVYFVELWVKKVSVRFLQQLDLKKNKYNYTDLTWMG